MIDFNIYSEIRRLERNVSLRIGNCIKLFQTISNYFGLTLRGRLRQGEENISRGLLVVCLRNEDGSFKKPLNNCDCLSKAS